MLLLQPNLQQIMMGKLILKQNFKSYNFYQMNFLGFLFESWEILSFVPAKELFSAVTCKKKGQSSTSRATPRYTWPPGHTTPKNSAAGAGRSSF